MVFVATVVMVWTLSPIDIIAAEGDPSVEFKYGANTAVPFICQLAVLMTVSVVTLVIVTICVRVEL